MMSRIRRSVSIRARREDRQGVAALEFAFVGLPFFLGLFAIMELALVFTVDSILDNATSEAGRLIRTGQAQSVAMSKEQFKSEVCDRMSVFSADCDSRLSVDVRVVEDFAILPDPIADGEFDDSQTGYSNGQPEQLILVRVWYRHPVVTNFLSQSLSRMEDGSALLASATAFRNEPPGFRNANGGA